MTALSREQFEELMADVPENGFKDLIPELMEAFANKEDFELSRKELAALVERLLGMADTIESQVNHIGELQKEVEECKKQSKLWTPE